MACYPGIIDSVHFYSFEQWGKPKAHDFGRLPQQVMVPEWTNEPQRGGIDYGFGPTEYADDYRNPRYELENQAKWNLGRARNLEVQEKYRQALQVYRQAAESPAFVQDRAELFRATNFRNAPGLSDYLRCTYLIHLGSDARSAAAQKQVPSLRCASVIQPHLAYLKAWAQDSDDGAKGARQYFDVYRAFPKSARAESALIMAARTMLEPRDEPIPKSEVGEARRYLGLLLGRFPRTRFRLDALGWLIRCDLLEGKEGLALAKYRKRAEAGATPAIRWKSYDSIAQICRRNSQWAREIRFLLLQRRVQDTPEHQIWTSKELRKRFLQISGGDARTIQAEIRRDPDLLESYVAFRIEDTELDHRQEVSLLRFAETSLNRMSRPTADLLVRVAQISYNNGHYSSAIAYARRVVLLAHGEALARAQYVVAASLARQGNHGEAIRQYEKLLASSAPPFLKQAAEEHLALLQERYGDRLKALRIFSDLGYNLDIGFMVDAELTPSQLQEYIARFAKSDQKPILTYTLGMRYFRLGDYARASSTFSRLSRNQRLKFGLKDKEVSQVVDSVTGFDELPLQKDPLKSVQTLWNLKRKSENAPTPAKKASALYAMATYMYHQRSLLFYSPGLWKGERSFSICAYWSIELNNRAEKRTLADYCHEHETLAHVMDLCREVEGLHVHNRTVAQAYYTEGIAAEKLSRLNEWWRGQPGLKKRASNSMRRLVKRFPHDPLAKPAAKYAHEFALEDSPDYSR